MLRIYCVCFWFFLGSTMSINFIARMHLPFDNLYHSMMHTFLWPLRIGLPLLFLVLASAYITFVPYDPKDGKNGKAK